ncbi:MAG: TonB-dependent receptor [Ignavibacteriales bacterium]|nr:MAG: TonB-dependent receptor [Ignavibacteriales bacterium]
MKNILALVVLFSISTFSQNRFLQGQLIDSNDGHFLSSANVILYQLPDSTFRGITSDSKGVFRFENLRPAKYILNISYVGYRTQNQPVEFGTNSIDLGKILLTEVSIETEEVKVIGETPPAVQSGDTTIYNADAFKTHKDASAEDLVTKLPGVTVQDGKIQSQGEDVKRVLVDGKPFFGDDPNATLKNIPAEIIERIQVFDQQSEQSQFTGFDDGNTTKAINVITRMKIQEGTFGKFSAGYGNEEKHAAGGNINFFDNDRRISILGQLNNINEQNFSNEDLLGVMSSSGGRGGGRFFQGPGRGQMPPGGVPGQGFFGGSASDFLVNSLNGLTQTKAFGLNYVDKWWNGFEISGSYFFNRSDNDAVSLLNRSYFLSNTAGQNYSENSLSVNDNTNHRFNLRVDYNIDSSNSIRFIPRFSLQQNDQRYSSNGKTVTAFEELNSTKNIYSSDLSAINASSQLLYRHQFPVKGRTIALSFNSSYKKNDGDKKLYSENIYNNNPAESDTIDQLTDVLQNGYSGSADITYTEPLSDNSQLMFNAAISYSQEKSDQEALAYSDQQNSYSVTDTSLSSVYKKIYHTNTFGTGYNYQMNDLSVNANLNFSIARLNNDQTFPLVTSLEKTFYSWLPSVRLRYGRSRDQSYGFFYRTFNTDPSVQQLQNVVNNSNPVQLSTGNPNLKQDYRHFFSMRYSNIFFESMTSLFVMVGGSITKDYIGSSTTIATRDTILPNGISLNRGSRLTTYENLDGYYSLRSFLSYGIPVSLIKSNLNLNINLNYTRTPALINGIKNFSGFLRAGAGFVIASNVGTQLDFSISSNTTYNDLKNSSSVSSNENYISQSSRVKLFWDVYEGIILQSELNHRYDGGVSGEYEPNSFLLTASVGKKIFADNSGEIRFTVYDLLNQNTNITRTTSESYTEDSETNVIGRYFFLSFIYNISPFK